MRKLEVLPIAVATVVLRDPLVVAVPTSRGWR